MIDAMDADREGHEQMLRRADRLRLSGMRVSCIVGVYPSERNEPQPLEIDASLYLDTRPAALGGGLGESIDYAGLFGELRFVLEASRFFLLEQAAEALCRYILAPPTADRPRARPVAVRLCLTKPDALAPHAVPSLEVLRRACDMHYVTEHKPFGAVDVVYETNGCGIYRLRVAPGAEIPIHVHRRMEEHELVLGEALVVQGEVAAPWSARSWPFGHAHGYRNPAAVEQTILCIDRPAFCADDEMPVPGAEEGALAPVPVTHYHPRPAR